MLGGISLEPRTAYIQQDRISDGDIREEGLGRRVTPVTPTRLFYAKHPEDDMTDLDIASQDAATLETAPTRYIEGSGIRFAYRRLGPSTGTPLVLLQHFSGNIDAWDPAVVNVLAADRPVIAFDNAGVGRSTGQTPDNIAAMARDAVAFINLLGLSEVDLLGFSLGGFVAQQIAAEHGRLVRKLILVGTAPKGGEEHLLAVLQEAFSKPRRRTPACRCSSRSRPPASRPAWRS